MSVLTNLAAGLLTPDEIGMKGHATDGNVLLTNVLDVVYLWAGIICVIVIIVAGLIYVTSNGNAANIKRGKDAIMGAVIGLIVVIFAFTITQFVIGRFA